MVRVAVADDLLLKYVSSVAKDYNCAIGLILGQSCLSKYYVVHFAKTPPFQTEESKKEGTSPKSMKNISEVNEGWVADHAKQVTRMLPGGMCVLGIFLVSDDDLLSPFNAKIKSLLSVIHKQLSGQKYLYGSNENEKLVFQWSPKTQKFYAKTYDVVTSNVQPADFKFLPKATKWNNLECKYVLDQVHYIKEEEAHCPLKTHIKVILESINDNLQSSIFLFDGESKDEEESLENIGKKRKVPRGKAGHQDTQESNKPMQVSIFQLCNKQNESCTFEVTNAGGQIRIVGEVACKLWLNPKLSIGVASNAVVEDIMRSLATRIEMHWDSLTEEEHSDEFNSVHEPPRRVLITLPDSGITLSDYLFPGEGPEDVKLSLEEMLDVKSDQNVKIEDREGQADITQYYNSSLESESEESLTKLPIDQSKLVYAAGIGIAVLVLIISLVIHFFR